MNARTLRTIEADLEAAFQREKQGPIEIGGFLIEAKELLDDHGRWLPWLIAHFPHSVRSAENYMAAHRFAAKFARVANLKLAPTALYALAAADHHSDPEVVTRALLEAETKWVSGERVYRIEDELRAEKLMAEEPPEEEPDEEVSPDDKPDTPGLPDKEFDDERSDEHGEAPEPDDASADDSPPDDERPPPPPPSLTPKQAGLVRTFDSAVMAFKPLLTKRAAEFAVSAVRTDDLKILANFLCQVAVTRDNVQTLQKRGEEQTERLPFASGAR